MREFISFVFSFVFFKNPAPTGEAYRPAISHPVCLFIVQHACPLWTRGPCVAVIRRTEAPEPPCRTVPPRDVEVGTCTEDLVGNQGQTAALGWLLDNTANVVLSGAQGQAASSILPSVSRVRTTWAGCWKGLTYCTVLFFLFVNIAHVIPSGY